MMPGMSGWDVFNRINKKAESIKVAFMSVLEISDKRKQVLLDQRIDYVKKYPVFVTKFNKKIVRDV